MFNEDLYQRFLSTWSGMVDSGMFEEAAQIDMMQYNEQIRKYEDVKIWDRWHSDTAEKRLELVNIVNKLNPSEEIGGIKEGSVALVYHNYSGLAHETQMARNIKYLRGCGVELDVHIIYAFGDPVFEYVKKAAEIYDVEESKIHFIKSQNYIKVGILIQELNAVHKFKTIIYPSEYYLAYWASLMLPHPNQKFLSMKYFPRKIGRFSDYAGGRGSDAEYFRINNEDWRQLSVLDIFSVANGGRYNYWDFHQNVEYFGSVSRIEKSCHSTYQDYIIEVLQKHKNLKYLYCGSESSLDLIDKRLSVHPRARFLGWVNPESMIKTFSIYLETFPWGGGDMSLMAIKLGVPYLCLATEENKTIGICRFLGHIAKNDTTGMASEVFCRDLDDLNCRFDKMVISKDYRESLRSAWTGLIENYQPSDVESWKSFLLS